MTEELEKLIDFLLNYDSSYSSHVLAEVIRTATVSLENIVIDLEETNAD